MSYIYLTIKTKEIMTASKNTFKSKVFKAAWKIVKTTGSTISDALKSAWKSLKNSFQTSEEFLTKMKSLTKSDVFNLLQEVGFCREYNGGYFTERTELQYCILDFIKLTSKGFQSDIATKGWDYKMSDKQAWCVAFEFNNLKVNL